MVVTIEQSAANAVSEVDSEASNVRLKGQPQADDLTLVESEVTQIYPG
jgi:hypothetical protein